MPKKCYILALIWLCCSMAAFAREQLFIEPEAGREPILQAIHSARSSIHLVMYGFTDERILAALIQQKSQGKDVKIILEEHPYHNSDENAKTLRQLKAHHIDWQGSIPPFRFIHQKTLLIDGRKALVMTFNFTHSTFKKERNFGLLLDDGSIVQAIEAAFAADWLHRSPSRSPPALVFSPQESRRKLIALIEQAKHEIKMYEQTVNDYKIVGVLAKTARRGIKIDLLTSLKMREKQANYLLRAGVKIRYAKHLLIHAKVILIDQQKAAVGSINLTRASLDDNRELAVITEDPVVIQQLTVRFDKDWQQAGGGWRALPSQLFSQQNLRYFSRVLRAISSAKLFTSPLVGEGKNSA